MSTDADGSRETRAGAHAAAPRADADHGARDTLADGDRGVGLLALTLVFLVFATVGALGTFVWQRRASLVDAYLAANEQRYLVMAGEVGPVTYLVEHEDYAALERFAAAREDVLGVEIYRWPHVAAMAFVDKDAPSIAATATLPGVRTLTRRHVPMICH